MAEYWPEVTAFLVVALALGGTPLYIRWWRRKHPLKAAEMDEAEAREDGYPQYPL